MKINIVEEKKERHSTCYVALSKLLVGRNLEMFLGGPDERVICEPNHGFLFGRYRIIARIDLDSFDERYTINETYFDLIKGLIESIDPDDVKFPRDINITKTTKDLGTHHHVAGHEKIEPRIPIKGEN